MSTTATTPPVIASSAQAHAAAARLATEIRVGVVERDANRAVPYGPLRALRESGLLGITVPPEYGGAGADRGTVTEIFRLIATADPAVAQIPQAHFGVIEALKASGSEAQQQRFFSAAL
ncbi:MAG: acyl-CoA dehydrogenase family protein, partial [Solirubrobacterales bacterium]|nr:acyl-CoA dehydrogenase family protein [Solirubrobacterales bacterium]